MTGNPMLVVVNKSGWRHVLPAAAAESDMQDTPKELLADVQDTDAEHKLSSYRANIAKVSCVVLACSPRTLALPCLCKDEEVQKSSRVLQEWGKHQQHSPTHHDR